ncbi:MAG: DEAD/DEAH box helicase family protein [Candidatus Thiodiazotropha taylori]|nr:DEAD/DEAH box helicase family protein [Candidatus Thiodiazotropha taylori]MCW4344238.1 DEAD/DEAH box helicase family protein [Candidatus Thiodiazotropha endolucinida]MCG8054025.1 DEAD/DEAH box helicase family protein [Candidatus Thiodiazotropha taylori]MCG8074551.1 DEAD/DEAH box helicase family protein [Candidatus Thiodiazotropha taylori]MCW4315849.1 DEAD/DEAH box helicase family protein [Candidatus Thiodiazotropha taylori]
MTISAHNVHKEQVLQDHLIDQLVTGEDYVRRNATTDYDRSVAMDKELVLRFLQDTQSEEWEKLTAHYTGAAEDTLFTQLSKALKDRGLLDVLRQGIKIVPGIKFSLCYFRPASGLEPKRVAEYQANILSVMKEVEYSTKHGNRLDVVLFLNGLPIVTMEAKNLLTGSTFRHAEKQYRKDRSPAGEPLLTFKRGALVHFALDEDNVSMTTRLQNGRTRFLPFNRGRDGGAGNSDVEDEFRVAYLYCSGPWGEAIFSRAVLIDVIGQFMHLETTGKNQIMIFPRFQQLDAVRKLVAHARDHGPGNNYLIQHSAGSGKSNTIGWLAHHAIKLHDKADKPVFDTAIIVTDRIVLDRQLQGTVTQFEQTQGVVKKIDGTSKQLKESIAKGARIIVTTIQKFSTDHLKEISGQGKRNFAVIVDEAHSSQSGKSAQAMSDALTREAASSDDIEDMIAAYQKARGPQANISFFAFTATPRNVTLERFGIKGPEGLPHPFHLYSMRQAIEEGFILDVLQNYMTYKAYYELEKAIEDDPVLSGRRGQRKVARYANLHPTAIGQKVEIIVEHFRRHVMEMLGGQAKAMIVTSSRDHALRYYFGVRDYIKAQGYTDMKALVAFSGELNYDGETYTEADLNEFSETELPSRFDGFKPDGSPYPDQYQILIVAEKYQTGFDQPKLCAMYVDRKLAGLQAVQTLSRLNRTMHGKDQTYILDFQNTIEDIQNAFRPYFEVTELEANSDPNLVYDLEGRLFKFGYLDKDEIERFAQTYFKGPLEGSDRARLEGLVREAVGRFEADEDEGRQEEFRQLLKSYMRFYSFIAQVMKLDDTSLEKLYSYGAWLARLLPNREVPPEIEITDDMLRLQAFKVEHKEQGSASLSPGDRAALKAIAEFGAKPYTEDEQKELSEIVKSFNERHGTNFTEEDMIRFEQVNREIMDDDLSEMLRNNPPDVVYTAFAQAFFQGAIRMFQRDNEMRNIVLTDADARDKATRHFFNRALREAREGVSDQP